MNINEEKLRLTELITTLEKDIESLNQSQDKLSESDKYIIRHINSDIDFAKHLLKVEMTMSTAINQLENDQKLISLIKPKVTNIESKEENIVDKIDNNFNSDIKSIEQKAQELIEKFNKEFGEETVEEVATKTEEKKNIFSSQEAEDAYNAQKKEVKKENTNKVVATQKVDTTKAKTNLKEKWNKVRDIAIPSITVLGVGLVLIAVCHTCNRKKPYQKEDITTYFNQDIEETKETTTAKVVEININNVDFTSESEIEKYAKYLIENNEALKGFTLEEVYDALKLANCTKLENIQVCENMNELINATYDAGKIITLVGSDNIIAKNDNEDIYLTSDQLNNIINEVNKSMNIRKDIGKGYHIVTLSTNDFANCKVNNKYDTCKVLETCVNAYKNKDDKAVDYAIVANEIMTEAELNFSINASAPLSEFYVLCGVYSTIGTDLENDQRLKFSTIYGNGNNDNLQGDICVEELVKYCNPENELNIFFNENEDFAKDLMKPAKVNVRN